MSGQTEYFGLHKPDPEDFYDIGRQNANADTMDAALQRVRQTAEAAIPAAQKGQPGGVAATEHQHRRADISDFPTALPADGGNAATVGGKTAGEFAAAVHTHQRAGITDFAHTHPKSQITDFPAAIKNPYALTMQTRGTNRAVYDGSGNSTFNVTPENVGLYQKLWQGTLNVGGSISAPWLNDWYGFLILTTQHRFITIDKKAGEYIKALAGYAPDKGLFQFVGLIMSISGNTLTYTNETGMNVTIGTGTHSTAGVAQNHPITHIYGLFKP